MITYEQKLSRNLDWALQEGGMHFQEESAVHKSLRRITQRLNEMGVPYAIVGGMAMFIHGYRRFTEDVDILVTPQGLKEIHARLEGLGYIPPFAGSKQLRDAESGVRIEFLVTGGFPGDGQPKPVAFPEPDRVSHTIEGMSVIDLPHLVELKLASGMTGAGRLRDLADVESLIKQLNLPRQFGDQLHPFVQSKFNELWDGVERGLQEP
jgi:hypothetical protein